MKIFQFASDLKAELNGKEKSIGFVPTMGALHQGHLSLIEQSQNENDITVCSIFVNPTQFNKKEDLVNYPSSDQEDIELLEKINCDYLYIPAVSDIYPKGPVSEGFDFGGIELEMEGKQRPGHFDGVGTVLKRLFEIIEPNKAYFGEKDFQQLQVVKKLNELVGFGIDIIGCPIYRESDGLAMSSRNKRLSAEQRKVAPLIFQTLTKVKSFFQNLNPVELEQLVQSTFDKEPLLDLEYFEIADIKDLKKTKSIDANKKYRAFISVFAGTVRLIDNIDLN
ncbi:pantoate--beta-alanine ligase [Flavobacteriaceae bacterium]|nr:pantoate--beta-alanine ligase [Flavobacteriaceae bacterium]